MSADVPMLVQKSLVMFGFVDIYVGGVLPKLLYVVKSGLVLYYSQWSLFHKLIS